MPEPRDTWSKRLERPSITIGGFLLFIDAVFGLSAWTALERQILLVPPIFIFFTLDHPLFLALLTILVCGIEYALKRTPVRFLLLGIAVLFLMLAVSHVRSQPGPEDDYGYRHSE